jgi:hypothetical protein
VIGDGKPALEGIRNRTQSGLRQETVATGDVGLVATDPPPGRDWACGGARFLVPADES